MLTNLVEFKKIPLGHSKLLTTKPLEKFVSVLLINLKMKTELEILKDNLSVFVLPVKF